MPKVHKFGNRFLFYCPGCKDTHQLQIEGEPKWKFNGDMEKPTFSPSYVTGTHNFTKDRCHSFIEDGMIRFLSDCDHELAGQTVEIPEWEKVSA